MSHTVCFLASVIYTNNTYLARAEGKTATCTAGEKQAVEALARKVCKPNAKVTITHHETVGHKQYFKVEVTHD
jgi:hypothetical protein